MTTDLQILRGANQSGPSTVAYASPPMGLRGTAKAAQKFASLFLRALDPVRGRGCRFTTLMGIGRIRTDSDVQVQFVAAALVILRQLGDQTALPATEQILRAELIGHSIFSDSVNLIVRLTTGDGTTDFQIPIEKV